MIKIVLTLYSILCYGYLAKLLGMHPHTGFLILLGIISGVSLGDRYYSKDKSEKYLLIVSIAITFLYGIYSLNLSLGIDSLPLIKYQLAVGIFLTLFITNLFQFKSELYLTELRDSLKVSGLFTLLLLTVSNFSPELLSLEKSLFLGLGFLAILSLLLRFSKVFLRDILGQRVVLFGLKDRVEKIHEIINSNSSSMYIVTDIILTDTNLKNLDDLNNVSSHDEIILAIPQLEDELSKKMFLRLDGKFRRIRYVPEIDGVFTFDSKVEDFDGELLITASENYFNPHQLKLKRVVDIIGSLIGVLLLAPIYFWARTKIRSEDSGPVFFAHSRVGMNLENFKMYKFRTMFVDAENRLEEMLEDAEIREEYYSTFKLKNDPRITRIGEFLRKTSLDEFPQFINVLKGEMSLVGPRPVVQKEVDMYYGTDLGRKIFLMKPGITGMWQSRGRSDIESYKERIRLDLYYLRNWSLILDLKIIFRTIRMVLLKKGAY